MSDQQQFNIRDPNPGTDITSIERLSSRARSLISRSRSNPLLSGNGFFSLVGAIEMIEALEYHRENIARISTELASGLRTDEAAIEHEAVAYINRFGQFYHFATSTLVRRANPDPVTLIPTIKKFMIFRNKYTAHRSIDVPRNESDGEKLAHLRAVSSMMGSVLSPIPNAPLFTLDDLIGTSTTIEEIKKRQWSRTRKAFQTYDSKIQSTVKLVIEDEHPAITQEAYNVVEAVVLYQ